MARQVVRELKQHDLDLPTRVKSKGAYGTLVWKRPGTLHRRAHPGESGLSGTYANGRWEYRGEQRSRHLRQSAGPPAPSGSMAGVATFASSSLCELGGVHTDPGTVAPELEAGWRSGCGPRRHHPVARDRLVWALWTQDGLNPCDSKGKVWPQRG